MSADDPFRQFQTLARGRRSLRRYTADPVPTALLEALLETAMWSPSAHNRQPWRYAVLTTAAARERLARAMGERLRADRLTDGDDPAVVEQDVARSRARLCGAPVVLVVCLSMGEMDRYPDARRTTAEYTMAVQSTAMSAQTLLLAAHAAGLGACWLCGPLFAPDVVRGALALPTDWEPQGLITLGYAAETRTRTRRPWHDNVLSADGAPTPTPQATP